MTADRLTLSLALAAGALCITGLMGCSKDAKSAKALQRAESYLSSGDYDKAEIEYKNAFQAAPNQVDAIGKLGTIYYEQGRPMQAAGFLRRAVELDPTAIEPRVKLGLLQLGAGRPGDAREAGRSVLTQNPAHPEAPLLLAEASSNAQEISEAAGILQGLPEPAPSSAPVLVALGILDIRRNDLPAAEAKFRAAIQKDPKFAQAHMALGRLYAAQRKTAEAEETLKQAAELAPLRSGIRIQYAQFLIQSGKASAARTSLEELLAKAPDYIPAWVQLAEMSFSEKRYDDAITQAERVLSRYPVSPEATLLSARSRVAKGEVDRAVTIMESAVARFPQAPVMHYELGVAYAAQNELVKAVASMNQAISLAPRYAPATLALAEIELRQGNTTSAIEALRKLLELQPTLVEGHMLMAQALRQQGNLDRALHIYREVDKAQTGNPTPSFLAGQILQQQGKSGEAREAFARALTLQPNYLPATEQLVYLELAEKNFAHARAKVDREIARSPEEPGGYVLLARVALAEEDFAGAENALKKVLSLKPDAAAAHAQLAQLYLRTKQEEKAIASLRAAFEANPRDTATGMTLGVMLNNRKDYAAARDVYEKVVAANPNAGAAFNNLAYIYAEHLVDLEKAATAAQRAYQALPSDPHVLNTHGWVLFKRKQYARALPLLREAADRLSDAAEPQYHLGLAYYMLGEETNAQAALERAIQAPGEFAERAAARERLAFLQLDISAPSAEADVQKALAQNNADTIALARAGRLLEAKKRFAEAFRTYESLLKISPNNLAAHLGAIRSLEAQNELPKAHEFARAARRIFPTDPHVAHLLGRLAARTTDARLGLSLLREAARSETGAELQFDLAAAAARLGDLATVSEALTEGLSRSPADSQRAWARQQLALAEWCIKPNQNSGIAERIELALKEDPASPLARFAQGLTYDQKGDQAGAVRTYEQLLEKHPEFAPAQMRLATLYREDPKNQAKAFDLATKARQSLPSDPEAAKALGIVVFSQKNFARASTLLEEASRQLPDDVEPHFYLGMAQVELKRPAEAKRSLERALQLGLTGKRADEARTALGRLE